MMPVLAFVLVRFGLGRVHDAVRMLDGVYSVYRRIGALSDVLMTLWSVPPGMIPPDQAVFGASRARNT